MKIIAYYRVSTDRQGRSGLGLESQRFQVASLVAARGAEIVAEFVEVESGRKADRPELAKALALAKQHGYTLVVAKLDRLARNVLFTATLMEAGIDFIACDMPTASRLTIHIMAAFAEEEARMISQRTKDALRAAKARGVLLGSARPGHWEGNEHKRGQGIRAKSPVLQSTVEQMKQLRSEGLTYEQIAERLNGQQLTTAQGKPWTKSQVHRFLMRALAAA